MAELKALVKLQIEAGKANPAPPIGPALGQHGLPIAQFCQEFNARAAQEEKGLKLPVVIAVFGDRSFKFIIKKPPASVLIRKALGLEKGSGNPKDDKVGALTQEQLRAIAETKMDDLNAVNLDAAERIIAGTARSMGVDVVTETGDA